MKIKIGIFVLPHEIDQYEEVVKQLKLCSFFLDDLEVEVDVVLSLSDELMNWNECVIPKDYFKSKFEKVNRLFDWALPSSKFVASEKSDILGCVSHRRNVWKTASDDTEAIMFIDCDMVFDNYALYELEAALSSISKSLDYYIITPQIVRIWDSTWDVIVNKNYMNKDHHYHKTADVYHVVNNVPEKFDSTRSLMETTQFKFAGGWLTTISKKLLDFVEIPSEFGHYGLEDTYIMGCAAFMRNKNIDVSQFVVEGMLVCENYKYRDVSYLVKYLSPIDRRDEFLEVAHRNFFPMLDKFERSKLNG